MKPTPTVLASALARVRRYWPALARVRRYWPALVALLFWVGAPALAVYGGSVGVRALASNIDNRVVGVPGTFLATSRSCQQQLCITSGTFTSKDKSIVVGDLIGDYRWLVGSSNSVVYNGGTGEVSAIPEAWDPTSTVVGLAGAGTVLVVWGFLLVRSCRERLSQRRSNRREQASMRTRTSPEGAVTRQSVVGGTSSG